MKVDSKAKYKLVFSIHEDHHLGVMIHPYVVEYTSLDTLSLTYQKVFSGNASYYTKLTDYELELIAILDHLMVEDIVRKFSPVKKIRPKEFYRKHFDKALKDEVVRPYIEKHLTAFFEKLDEHSDQLYEADEINPAAIPIRICKEFTKVLFHFRKNENGTSYFVTLKQGDQRVPFMKLGALLPVKKPARLIVNGEMHKFYDFVEGGKIGVFIHKKFIHIRPENERVYYQKFVKPLLETAPVFAQGFDIETRKEEATPVLQLSTKGNACGLELLIRYGEKSFPYQKEKLFHVDHTWKDDLPYFTKYKRSKIWEANRINALAELGLTHRAGSFFGLQDSSLVSTMAWLRTHRELLELSHFVIDTHVDKNYTLASTTIDFNISDKIDWFDLNVVVKVGEFQIPFSKIVAYMKKGEVSMDLPNGECFVFPEEWFAIGEALTKGSLKSNVFSVKKFDIDVLSLIESKKIKSHLNNLVDIKAEKPHSKFVGSLRPYQLDGLSWLMFLKNNRFGGILADDMGLGKTVQTLAFLQKVKGRTKTKDKPPRFLLIAPTSLLYNWQHESETFTPNLRVKIHAGTRRAKELEDLFNIDLLITSYGLIRNDAHLFEAMEFEVVMLDESQNIKNHTAKTTQYINKLKSECRIALTGTPIENSIRDLWSQMNFLNKGLLGSMKQFEENYAKPIEKQADKKKAEELRKKIKPFLLRRTKAEVAKELPPITEKIVYCEMSPAQAEIYEEVKSQYRNSILENIEEEGLAKSKFSILQGLSKLRQIANHPKLVDAEYKEESGKHSVLIEKIRNAVADGHKVLVFSQFVTYLKMLQKDLDSFEIPLYTLTGSTSKENRSKAVSSFQKSKKPSAFLISLKAGGTGLNLTSADYVFIVDPWWNPAAEAQARDRTHRIGQMRNVMSYKFISRDTIEEKIVVLQQKKQSYSNDIIVSENNILKNLDINELEFLLA